MEKNTKIPAHGGEYEINEYGKDSIKLDYSVNLNPLGIPASIDALFKDSGALSEMISHYPSLDHGDLISRLAEKRNIPKDWILMGNGASEIISLIAESAGSPAAPGAQAASAPSKGSCAKALIIEPTFSGYERALSARGIEILRYELNEAGNKFRSEAATKASSSAPEAGAFALTEDIIGHIEENPVDMVFACSPNNPTGRVIEPGLLKKLADKCKELNTILVIDECFMGFTKGNENANSLDSVKDANLRGCNSRSAAGLLRDNDHIILIDAFTKLYSMPGIRLGYCICSNTALIKKMQDLTPEWNISAIAEAAGTAALSEDEYVQRAQELIEKERAFLTKGLTNLGFTVYPSDANFILVKLPYGINSVSFYERMIKDHGILLRNCSNFHGLDESFYRIAVKNHDDNEALLESLSRSLQGAR